jgi:hypothetical protein
MTELALDLSYLRFARTRAEGDLQLAIDRMAQAATLLECLRPALDNAIGWAQKVLLRAPHFRGGHFPREVTLADLNLTTLSMPPDGVLTPELLLMAAGDALCDAFESYPLDQGFLSGEGEDLHSAMIWLGIACLDIDMKPYTADWCESIEEIEDMYADTWLLDERMVAYVNESERACR